jgi:beta-galactosidase
MKVDLKSIKEDLQADTIRVGEFMWHAIEPADNVFNFTLLDTIIDAAEDAGLKVMLGTPTATMPAWLYTAHGKDVVAVGPDSPEGYAGATASFGGRRQYSFNSPIYQKYATRIVSKLVGRYGARSVVQSWQVDNELGHEGSDLDFSDSSKIAWREWLVKKFSGQIELLNQAWGTAFWSATYDPFEQIPLPKYTVPGAPGGSRPNENFRSNTSPGMLLDFRLFRADSIAAFADAQINILRSGSTVPQRITTNSPGGVWGKAMDSNKVFANMDFVSYDNYPVWGGSTAPTAPSMVALQLDTVRGWGRFDSKTHAFDSFTITEQLIGAQGHDIIGFTPRPGQIVGWSAQTLTHGAASLLFFRYRAAVFGQEEFCYGVLDHYTPRGTGRKWKEAKELFSLARSAEDLWDAPIAAEVAVLYDQSNIFAWQAQPQSTAFDFTAEVSGLKV